ncbi:MAG: TerD family protein [Frankiaceae bacterium]
MSQTLSKGANCPLPVPSAQVAVGASEPLDIAALLVTQSGKVRSDDDFVFYNQPTGPGVQLTSPTTLHLDLPHVPRDIDKLVVTASLDGTRSQTFATVQQISVTISDLMGTPIARFDPSDLTAETALVLIEMYRRAGSWKIRAVGQGYASGLAGIATDFGISVDEPRPAAAPAAPHPPQQPGGWPAQPQQGWPQGAGTPVADSAPAAGPPGAPPAGRVNLDKGRVSLRKGQSVSLVKTGAAPLNRVRMGLGWDVGFGEQIDLDASVILYDSRGKDVDKVWFMSKKGGKGAVRHSGDNLTGAGEGDDEVIYVDLMALPADVNALVFTVNSFRGQSFRQVRNAFCRLVDDMSGAELVRFDLTDSKDSTGIVMCKVQREGPAWVMTAIGEFHDGKTVRAMVDPAKQYL